MLIALSALARCGKTTFASVLQKEIKGTIAKFATPLYKMIEFFFSKEDKDNKKEIDILGLNINKRRFLSTLGTDWGRKLIHKDLWVKYFDKTTNLNKTVIIDDVRFENEVQYVLQKGGIWIILLKDNLVYDASYSHQSEKFTKNIVFSIIPLYFLLKILPVKFIIKLYNYFINRIDLKKITLKLQNKYKNKNIYLIKVANCNSDLKKLNKIYKEKIRELGIFPIFMGDR